VLYFAIACGVVWGCGRVSSGAARRGVSGGRMRMPGPVPGYRPTSIAAHVRDGERRVRQQHAPRVQGARAQRAVPPHTQPGLDGVTAVRHPGPHPAWAYTRRRCPDRATGARAEARFPPAGGRPGGGAGVYAADAA